MSMEKNGAISSETPGRCCGGNCNTKSAAERAGEIQFPESVRAADIMDDDLTKKASDAVERASRPNS